MERKQLLHARVLDTFDAHNSSASAGEDVVWSSRNAPPQRVCQTLSFFSGHFITEHRTVMATREFPVLFSPCCDATGRPILIESQRINYRNYAPFIVSTLPGWNQWLSFQSNATLDAYMCMFSVAYAIVLCSFLLVITRPYFWRDKLFFISVLLTFAHMNVLLGCNFGHLYSQYIHFDGYSMADLFIYLLQPRTLVTNFLSATAVTFAELQLTATKLVDRKIETYMVWVIGTPLVLASLIFAALAFFYDQRSAIIFTLAYLFFMGVNFLFSLMVCLYAISHRRTTMRIELIGYTLLAVLSTLTPTAFYMADIIGWWIARGVNYLCVFSSVLALVMCHIWSKQIDEFRARRERTNVMGRKLYNDNDKRPYSGKRAKAMADSDETALEPLRLPMIRPNSARDPEERREEPFMRPATA